MSMNLANLINDGKLKKSFMVATLVSTLLGTFTTAATLHDKIQDKRQQAKQKQTDEGQNDQIKGLREDVERMQLREEQQRLQGKSETESNNRSRSHRSRSQRRKSVNYDDYSDDGSDGFDREAQRSKQMIQREYEANFARMGQRYAQGDVITENKLQSQIIALQQTVIDTLQDALVNGRTLGQDDIQRLIAAQDRAKQGSLDAMRDQYERMLLDERRRSQPENDARNPRKQLTLPSYSTPEDNFPPVRRVQTVPANMYSSPGSLYCRYALDLQSSSRTSIHSAFSANGSQQCPACNTYIPITTSSIWVIETRTPLPASQQDDRGDLVELRRYTMDARLVLKSHREDGGFACAICWNDKEGERDCLCSSVEALVKHIGRDHRREDLEAEVDIWRE